MCSVLYVRLIVCTVDFVVPISCIAPGGTIGGRHNS